MPHDFKHKEPSKTEKVLYELMRNQQGMERALWSNSSVVMAIAMLQKVDPEKIAEMLVDKEPEMKEYSKKINDAIKKLEEKKDGSAETSGSHDHDHVHTEEEEVQAVDTTIDAENA